MQPITDGFWRHFFSPKVTITLLFSYTHLRFVFLCFFSLDYCKHLGLGCARCWSNAFETVRDDRVPRGLMTKRRLLQTNRCQIHLTLWDKMLHLIVPYQPPRRSHTDVGLFQNNLLHSHIHSINTSQSILRVSIDSRYQSIWRET